MWPVNPRKWPIYYHNVTGMRKAFFKLNPASTKQRTKNLKKQDYTSAVLILLGSHLLTMNGHSSPMVDILIRCDSTKPRREIVPNIALLSYPLHNNL